MPPLWHNSLSIKHEGSLQADKSPKSQTSLTAYLPVADPTNDLTELFQSSLSFVSSQTFNQRLSRCRCKAFCYLMFEASSFLVQGLQHVLHSLLPAKDALLLTKHHLMSTGPHTYRLQAFQQAPGTCTTSHRVPKRPQPRTELLENSQTLK